MVCAVRCILLVFFLLQWITIIYLCWALSEERHMHFQIRELETKEKFEIRVKFFQWMKEILNERPNRKGKNDDETLIRSIKDDLQLNLPESDYKTSDDFSCGLEVPSNEKLVCDEKFLGTYTSHYIYNGTWTLDMESCTEPHRISPTWNKILTVLLIPEADNINYDLEWAFNSKPYKDLAYIIGQKPGVKINLPGSMKDNVQIIPLDSSYGSLWASLLPFVQTEMVLFGRDLESISDWTLIERSVRLLQSSEMAAVAGATRNKTGHWRTSCHQSKVSNYALHLQPGYETSLCDCMLCPLIGPNTPFMTKRSVLKKIPLKASSSEEANFINWFLDVQQAGYKTLQCPDVLYMVHGGESEQFRLSKQDWHKVAVQQRVQGIFLKHDLLPEVTFPCAEVGLQCDPEKLQNERKLLPWCCLKSYKHILQAFESICDELGIHYELQSGSMLGAIKLGLFMPWDIDGDGFFPSQKLKYFKPGGSAHRNLTGHHGIKVHDIADNKYGSVGIGFFKMTYGGVEMEVIGRHQDNMSLSLQPQSRRLMHPTRVRVAGLWVKTMTNPGQYARSRYGPGYLAHAQSWRQEGLSNAYSTYQSGGGWKLCEDPRFHGCLEKYPTEGNMMFHQDYFTQWDMIPLEP